MLSVYGLDRPSSCVSPEDSYLKITDTQIKFLKPDIAILHCTWEISGQQSPDGQHALQNTGVWTAIVTQQENIWEIAALQNTGTIPLNLLE